jgi:hypothetical protein
MGTLQMLQRAQADQQPVKGGTHLGTDAGRVAGACDSEAGLGEHRDEQPGERPYLWDSITRLASAARRVGDHRWVIFSVVCLLARACSAA